MMLPAAGNNSTKGGMIQTKYACGYYYSDGKFANDAYVDLKHVDRRSMKYLAIFEALADDGPNLAFM